MEQDIAEGKLGTVGDYDLEFKGGKLVFKLSVPGVGVTNTTEVSATAVIGAIKKAIPGQIDDAILGVLEAALIGS